MDSLKSLTKPSFLCESDSSEILNLANSVVKNKSGRAAVKLLFEWVRDNVDYGVANVVGAKGVLKRTPMKAVCIDKANLIIALCRALGYPAKYVALSCKLKSKEDLPVMPHMYAEVFFDRRWHKIDPNFGNNTRHFIEPSEFDKIKNWQLVGKESKLNSLPLIVPLITRIMYVISPTAKKLKSVVNKEK